MIKELNTNTTWKNHDVDGNCKTQMVDLRATWPLTCPGVSLCLPHERDYGSSCEFGGSLFIGRREWYQVRTTLDLVGIDGLDFFPIEKCYYEITPFVSLMSSPSLLLITQHKFLSRLNFFFFFLNKRFKYLYWTTKNELKSSWTV